MEQMFAKWIQETIREQEIAKANQNLLKMNQMKILRRALQDMRDNLLNILS